MKIEDATFYGKPIRVMTRQELLQIIEWQTEQLAGFSLTEAIRDSAVGRSIEMRGKIGG